MSAAATRRVVLGLGSNLGDRADHLRTAVAGLGPEVAAVSAVYETAPVGGPGGQGPYLNLVVVLRSARPAPEVLARAQALEDAARRVRVERWGPRTLDVDVLWIDGETWDRPELTVPHPRMFERDFVLAPLADVAPDLVPPGWAGPAPDVVPLGALEALGAGAVRPEAARALGPAPAGAASAPHDGRPSEPGGGTGPGRAPSVRIVGPGRAGSSLGRALAAVGWDVVGYLGRGDDPGRAAAGVDLLVIATPDRAVAEVAAAVRPDPGCVVAHLAGSLGLDVLAPHPRRASVHPLASLPDPGSGAARLRAGTWFAVAGDPLAERVVADLGGRAVAVPDEQRAAYHAAACIASNHLVALLGQVERVAGPVGVPLAAFLDLARGSLDNVAARGPAAALTGPAARGDEVTVARHRAALDPSERAAYDALAAAARRLAGRPDPP